MLVQSPAEGTATRGEEEEEEERKVNSVACNGAGWIRAAFVQVAVIAERRSRRDKKRKRRHERVYAE